MMRNNADVTDPICPPALDRSASRRSCPGSHWKGRMGLIGGPLKMAQNTLAHRPPARHRARCDIVSDSEAVIASRVRRIPLGRLAADHKTLARADKSERHFQPTYMCG